MIQHERHFQYLIALAVGGQISAAELAELNTHKAKCSSCSGRMAEMESTNLQLFLTLAAQGKNSRISSKMQERFLIRAAHSGVPMAAPSSRLQRSSLLHFAALFVAVCLFMGMGWRHIRHGSLERATGSSSSMGIAAPAQLLTTAGPDLATSQAPIAEHSINRRRNRHAPGYAAVLSSFATDKESRVVARSLFRLDPALFPRQPGSINHEAGLSGLQRLAVEDFSASGGGLTPHFSAPTIRNADMNGDPNQRVFHYSATLASISLQDDQAVFGLKPQVRDLSFSSTLNSNRPR